ncbi:MAG: hypothetical protein RO257_14980 [Candidatus Kapabacteria bacterium]|nr:hypothetical protein [Candidatus Kapabacteria bacterium]
MLNKIFVYIIILFSSLILQTCSHTRSVSELEKLIYKAKNDSDELRLLIEKMLQLDKYNKLATSKLLDYYWYLHHYDSVDIYFNDLIKKNPNSTEPYILKAEVKHSYFTLRDTNRITVMKTGLLVDSNCQNLNFKLGINYYQLFLWQFEAANNKLLLKYFAQSTQYYLDKLIKIKSPLFEVAKYPLIQVTNFLGDTSKVNFYTEFKFDNHIGYYPLDLYFTFPLEWKNDYKRNIYEIADFEFSRIKGISNMLSKLNEPNLLDQNKDSKIFRFLLFRAFEPKNILIRFENNADTIQIFCKVFKWQEDSEKYKILVDKNKNLTIKEWNEFLKKIDELDFWHRKNFYLDTGLDGSNWYLEGRLVEKYNSLERWSPRVDSNYQKVCLYLLNLTDIDINEKETKIRFLYNEN